MAGAITAWWLGRPEKLSEDTISVVAVSMLASQIRIDGILRTTAREARIGIWSGDFDMPRDWRPQRHNR